MNSAARGKSKRSEARSDADALQAVMRFLRMLRYRKQYIVVAMIVAALLTTLYYSTAPRIYEATAALLVTHHGPDVLRNSNTSTPGQTSRMPTYERVLTSAVVLEGAIRQLREMPQEMCVDFASRPKDKWVAALKGNLRARVLRRSNVIDIRYRSRSPAAGAAVVRAVVDSYLDFMEKHHKDASVEIVELLNVERAKIEEDLVDKQQELLEVSHRVGDLGIREGTSVMHPVVQRVARLNETFVEVQKERLHLRATLTAINAAIRQGKDLRQHVISADETIGRELVLNGLGLSPQTTETVNSVERQLIEDRARLKILHQHYGPIHPDVVEAEQAIHNAEDYLVQCHAPMNERLSHIQNDQLASLLVSMVGQKLEEARAHEQELADQFAQLETEAIGLNDRMAELEIVKNEVQRLRNLHQTLMNRISTVDINQNQTDVRVAVISEPAASNQPVSPRLSIMALMWLLGGLGGGAALAYVVDLMDDRFRSLDELNEQLGLPLLAMVRNLPSAAGTGIDSLQLHVAPREVEGEAFRTLRTTLSISGSDLERVAVTSSEPGDGKTTVLANLAVAYAMAGKRTLLIDADMRRPGLSKLLEARGSGGLAEVLRTNGDIADICRRRIQATGIHGLDVLPCGARPADPAELLSQPRMADLVSWADDVYDQVLIDCPPMLAASDAALIGQLVDGIMLVVKPHKNPRRAVLRTSEMLNSLEISVIGVVANLVGDERDSGYYGYNSEYGYGYGHGSRKRGDRSRDNKNRVDDDHQDDLMPRSQLLIPRRAA